MPLKMKQKQITVQVSELTIELDQHLTRLLTDAAEAESAEPDAYVLALIQEHFASVTSESAPEKPAAARTVDVSPSPQGTAGPSITPAKTRGPKSPKPRYLGKLSELTAFGDEGNDIALELKNKGLISTEQYEAVLNGEIPKGKAAAISQDAQNYIVEQLTKADAGSGVLHGNGDGSG